MSQIGFEEQWLEVIRSYVVPVNGKVYPGYYSKVSRCGRSACPFAVPEAKPVLPGTPQ